MGIAAILLAAGRGKRFGSDKRLQRIDGEAMLFKTIKAYRDVFDDLYVVVRTGETQLIERITERGATVVRAIDADLGQSRSLAAGVQAASAHDQIAVGLGDMPFVRGETLRAICEAAKQHPDAIVRPRHDGKPGHPIVFPRALHGALTTIEGDQGARQIVRDHAETIVFVDVDDAGTITDVDQPGDVGNA